MIETKGMTLASMRPAHYAREVVEADVLRLAGRAASMRPAHYAREVDGQGQEFGGVVAASMRPAHYAREVSSTRSMLGSDWLLQ